MGKKIRDIIDGVNYWIYWYEYEIAGGAWNINIRKDRRFLFFSFLDYLCRNYNY